LIKRVPGASALILALMLFGPAVAGDGELSTDPPDSARSVSTKSCLFRWGLTRDEKSIVAAMIRSSDGSHMSRQAIFDKYSSFCAGQEYLMMTSCVSFSKNLEGCLEVLDIR
jgi:hypothetical protein